jgi:LytS/YehU family sensor histidine kinase
VHPVLAGRRPLAAYLAAWLPAAALLAAVLALSGSVSWTEAALLAAPLALLYSFVGLGAFWVCQAAPLRLGGIPRVLATQLTAAAISAAAWTLAARTLATLYERSGLALAFDERLAQRTAGAAPLVFGMGVLLFLLAAALHYLLAAFEASRQAETEALHLTVHSREAELRALRAQLHPHFFFNSLNSISALVGTRPEEARRVCQLLAELLRKSLAAGNRESVTLAEEVALARSYLSVEQVRFGERLGVETRIEAAAEDWKVPSLLLQPLVENAITHGVSARLEGGTVTIEAKVEDGRLLLVVENPRDPDSPSREGTGLGLENVRRRLAAVYGREAGFRVAPGADRFRVELRLPSPDHSRGPDRSSS